MDLRPLRLATFSPLVVAFALSACGSESERAASSQAAIVSGDTVDPENSGFVIVQPGGAVCSGTLVNNEWVLTAKHCFNAAQVAAPSTVRSTMGSQSFLAKEVLRHNTIDAALVHLDTPMTVDGNSTTWRRRLWPLPATYFGPGFSVPCYGYGGWTYDGAGWGPLRNAFLPISAHATINFQYFPIAIENNSRGQGLAHGDSGGSCTYGRWDSVVGEETVVTVVSEGYPDVAKGLDPDDFRKWFSSSLVSHEITNRMTGKCVDVNLATTRVEQWSCFDTQPQRFGLVDVGGGSWEIHAGNSGECVRADAQYPVKPGACDGSSATRWWVSSVGDDYYQIHNRQMSDWCLDIPGGSGADGFALQVYPCHTGQNQQFRFDARFRNTVQQLRPVGSSLVVDVAGGTAGNGQPLQLHTRHGYPNQQWTLGALGGDDASASPLSGLAECIDVPWGSTADGVTLQQWQCHGGDNQRLQARWREGAYVFRFKSSNKCLSVPTTGLATSGTLLEQRTCDASGSTQRWELY